MCKELKERFRSEVAKFKQEFSVEPNLFTVGAGVYHELNSMDCDEFFTPQRVYKGDSFAMGIKIEVIKPIDMDNNSILTSRNNEWGDSFVSDK